MSQHGKRIRVAVVYGGRSTEHEVSLRSAASVVKHLDPNVYEVVPVSIDPQGVMRRVPLASLGSTDTLPIDPSAARLSLPLDPSSRELGIDVVFPVVHGPLCEDGSLQGAFELADLPYVGSRVLGSSVSMDKDVAKRLVRAEGIAIAPYVSFHTPEWQRSSAQLTERVERELGYSVFVKPATLGSSIGVSRASSRTELQAAVQDAQRYDDKVLVERAIDAREIELAVLASQQLGAPPEVSIAGEIVPREQFYSFERKYLQATGADLHIPAPIDATVAALATDYARRIFLALCCEGLARVDFFLDRKSGELLFNEINTLPGFTAISMYPKLWAASGVPYPVLLDRLVRDALARHAARAQLQRTR
ncbi:MAG TPA: D-alanine--D-alanine ligase family protein [Polyangiales bacterium]|nr:D-alanine--D-alanine ligase family protein [Polyangiales bacterium]